MRRRGMASGVMTAGTSVGALFLPIILPNLVNAYGTATTLRILSVAIMVLILPSLPFLRRLSIVIDGRAGGSQREYTSAVARCCRSLKTVVDQRRSNGLPLNATVSSLDASGQFGLHWESASAESHGGSETRQFGASAWRIVSRIFKRNTQAVLE